MVGRRGGEHGAQGERAVEGRRFVATQLKRDFEAFGDVASRTRPDDLVKHDELPVGVEIHAFRSAPLNEVSAGERVGFEFHNAAKQPLLRLGLSLA